MNKTSHNTYNNDSDEYPQFEQCVINTFKISIENRDPLFTTDASGLFEAYISGLPEEARQHYTCNACRHFIERYGGLVTISEDGDMKSALWVTGGIPSFFVPSAQAMHKIVSKSKVTGVFFSKFETLGTPVTGEWTHLAVSIPSSRVYKERVKGITEITAEKKADFTILMSGLVEYPQEAVEQAVNLLNSEALYRSEKVLGVATWLRDLHLSRATTKNKKLKDNIVWLAVATAPPGFCHVKSTMIGTLLDDLVAGLPFEVVSRRFAEKMSPLQYQRPQAAPTTGNIERAEKLVEKLGIKDSLVRRFARLEEIETIWKPIEDVKPEGAGVFSHLKPKNEIPKMEIPAITMTWKKFSETVLPNVKSIEYYVNSSGNFSAILTAQNYDAPPIIQWDNENRRNPFSQYVYSGGSTASNWNLTTGYCKVTGICYVPSMWVDGFEHQSKGVFFLLEGAKDSRYKTSGNALFPEILKNELREVRSTIEAYSHSAEIFGYEEASACGMKLQYGSTWNAKVRVTTDFGVANYIIDRWD